MDCTLRATQNNSYVGEGGAKSFCEIRRLSMEPLEDTCTVQEAPGVLQCGVVHRN